MTPGAPYTALLSSEGLTYNYNVRIIIYYITWPCSYVSKMLDLYNYNCHFKLVWVTDIYVQLKVLFHSPLATGLEFKRAEKNVPIM